MKQFEGQKKKMHLNSTKMSIKYNNCTVINTVMNYLPKNYHFNAILTHI